MNSLRDELLRQDGLDPAGVAEEELAGFRRLLAQERKRARRLGWMIQIPLWGALVVLLGVCVGEDLWDRLDIPFLAVNGLAVIAIWLIVVPVVRRLGRRLDDARSRIHRLKGRLPEYAGTQPWGIPVVARQGQPAVGLAGQRLVIFWPGVLLVAVLVSLIAAVVGNVVWLALTGRFSGSVALVQVGLGLLIVAGMVRHVLTRPPDELTEKEHPHRLFWIVVPPVLTFRVPRSVRLTVLMGLLGVMAAIVIVSLCRSSTVYAQVLTSVQRARSIHAVGYGFENGQPAVGLAGQPVKQVELWYRRGVGTRIQWQRGGQLAEAYDDGENRYEFVPGRGYAVKRQGQGQLLPREITDPLHYLKDCERDAARDETIGGTLCACYKREDPNSLSVMWIDDAMQFRRYEEYRRVEGQWRQEELIEIDYGASFELDMPPAVLEQQGVRIIEPARILETRYGLDRTIGSREVVGLVFAVHELYRSGDYLFVTCSVRPTEQSLKELVEMGHEEPSPTHLTCGGFDLTSWWQRREDGSMESRPYAIAPLGRLDHQGAVIGWYALLPRGQWPGQGEHLEVCADVRTYEPLRQLRQERGWEWRGQFRPLLTIDVPQRQSDLKEIGKDLYEVGHLITSVGRAAQDLFVSDTSGVSAQQFQQRLETLLAGLRPLGELWDQVGSDLSITLLDEQGAPVAGAYLGVRLNCAEGGVLRQDGSQGHPPTVSDERGRAQLSGRQFFSPDSSRDSRQVLYSVHPQRRLAALYAVSGNDFGGPVTMTMRKACRVRARLACPEVEGGAEKVMHADLRTSVPRGFSANRILLTVLSCTTSDGSFEVLLPPGEYMLDCNSTAGGSSLDGHRNFSVPETARELNLGTIELKTRP